jgi:hypothetical protein
LIVRVSEGERILLLSNCNRGSLLDKFGGDWSWSWNSVLNNRGWGCWNSVLSHRGTILNNWSWGCKDLSYCWSLLHILLDKWRRSWLVVLWSIDWSWLENLFLNESWDWEDGLVEVPGRSYLESASERKCTRSYIFSCTLGSTETPFINNYY